MLPAWPKPRFTIAGNWKMHGLGADLEQARRVIEAVAERPLGARVALFPPLTLLERMARIADGKPVLLGAQTIDESSCEPLTGGVSADMARDAGASLVILGHSERRRAFGETDAQVADKVRAALGAGLEPIVCVGESAAARGAGSALAVIERQLAGSLPAEAEGRVITIAYEPVWAIGAGKLPSHEDIAYAHQGLRQVLERRMGDQARATEILYGGSVTAGNATEVLRIAGVDGVLVGGAALRADDFLPIVWAAEDHLSRSPRRS